MYRISSVRSVLIGGTALSALLLAPRAEAIPAFASQTGQPCVACHIGGYGPQLTPFGRAFKIGGYTATGGDDGADTVVDKLAYGPISGMVLSSFNNTAGNMPEGTQQQHYARNNNFSLDQVSIFIGGRLTDWAGGFGQFTWSDVDNTAFVDQVDLRPYTHDFTIEDNDVRVGLTVNNAPTVQDPYNSSFVWGYPYVSSAIAPSPGAQPILAGGFAGNSIGITAYAWINRSIYLEVGGYQSQSPWLLARFGEAYGPGATQGIAPYLRAAYEWDWGPNDAHVGFMFMQSAVNPTVSAQVAANTNGHDSYTDFAVDMDYQFVGERDTFTILAVDTMEQQNLAGTVGAYNAANGTTLGNTYNLNQIRLSGAYWYRNTYGFNLGWERTWGTANPAVYSANAVSGSNNSKPDSNAFILEADWVPFGKGDSWAQPFANLKLGVQYTIYTQFNGGYTNYDGNGRNANANNTLYAFAWFMF